MGKNIGVFGGSFDPVHWGHLVMAEVARTGLALEEVLFIPAGHQWLKGRELSSWEARWEMLGLALASNPHFVPSRMEIDRSGPSYTIDTLSALSQQEKDRQLFFLLGLDSLAQLPQWKDPQRLIGLCKLVALPRIGVPPPDLEALAKLIPGIMGRIILLQAPLIGISSSEIRERVARGLSIRYLVPPVVEKYITEQGLYRC